MLTDAFVPSTAKNGKGQLANFGIQIHNTFGTTTSAHGLQTMTTATQSSQYNPPTLQHQITDGEGSQFTTTNYDETSPNLTTTTGKNML